MIENILFDLDGTLTDPAEGITNSIAYSLEKMKRPALSYDALCRWIGPPLLENYAKIGLVDADGAAALAAYREYFTARGMFENLVYDGIPETLGALKAAGKKLYIATSKPEPFAEKIAAHFGLARYFYGIAGATLSEERTKKGEVIAYLSDRFGVPLDARTVMVGDRRHDVLGAAECGLACVGVLYGYGSREELCGAEAKYLCDSPAALGTLLLSL